MSAMKERGFTLVELVVAIAISAVVVVFASMFIAAPLDAYGAQARRSALAAEALAGWPRLEEDLRRALPNSVRVRVNGSYVALEMLSVVDYALHLNAPDDDFIAVGTALGVFRGINAGFNRTDHYLSVGNLGQPGVADAYELARSMSAANARIQITPNGGGQSGRGRVRVTPAPAFTAASPNGRVYLVSGAVTYLCDQARGELWRYSGYAIAALQSARDAPGDFAGATSQLMARGLNSCDFSVRGGGASQPQVAAIALTATRDGDTLTLLRAGRSDYLP
jgi:MSHA biogenesis protein MshO